MAALGTGGPPAAHGLPWLLLLLAVASMAFSSRAAAQEQAWTVVTDPAAAGTGVEVTRVSGAQRPFSRPPPRTLDPQLLSDFLPAFNLLQDVSPTGDNTFTDVQDQVQRGAAAVQPGCRQAGWCRLAGRGAVAVPPPLAQPSCLAALSTPDRGHTLSYPRPSPRTSQSFLCASLIPSTPSLHPPHTRFPSLLPLQYVATIHSGFVEGEAGLVYDAAARAYHLPNLFFTRVNPLLPLPQRSVAEVSGNTGRYIPRTALCGTPRCAAPAL
jgi:hypothetical protein